MAGRLPGFAWLSAARATSRIDGSARRPSRACARVCALGCLAECLLLCRQRRYRRVCRMRRSWRRLPAIGRSVAAVGVHDTRSATLFACSLSSVASNMLARSSSSSKAVAASKTKAAIASPSSSAADREPREPREAAAAAAKAPSSADFATFQKLRSLVPECASLSDLELAQVAAQTTPPMLSAKQKILGFVFESLGIDGVRKLLDTRKVQRRQEIQSNVSDADRRSNEDVFRTVFNKIVWRELDKLSFATDGSRLASVLDSRSLFIDVLAFLLDSIQSRSRSQPGAAASSSLASSLQNKRSSANAQASGSNKHPQVDLYSGSSTAPARVPPTRSSTLRASTNNPLKQPDATIGIADLALVSRLASTRTLASHSASARSELAVDAADAPFFEQKQKASSAELDKLKQELAQLKQDHAVLTEQHNALKDLYDKSVQEVQSIDSSGSPIDTLQAMNKRRIMLLKSQNTQLLRQVDVYRHELESREGLVYDVSGSAKEAQDKLKQLAKLLDGDPKSFSGSDAKKLLAECIKMMEAMHKFSMRHTKDRLDTGEGRQSANFQFLTEFLSSGRLLPSKKSKSLPNMASIDDTASGRIGHLNLRHVARLETELHSLFGDLVQLKQCIATSIEPNVATIVQQHAHDVVQRAMQQTVLVAESLMSLQVLVPAPPLPRLHQVLGKEDAVTPVPTLDDVLSIAPSAARAKLREPLELLFKASAAREEMHDQEAKKMRDELEFHRGTYAKYNTMIAGVIDKLDHRRKQVAAHISDSLAPLVLLQERLGSLELTREAVVVFLEEFEQALGAAIERVQEIDSMSVTPNGSSSSDNPTHRRTSSSSSRVPAKDADRRSRPASSAGSCTSRATTSQASLLNRSRPCLVMVRECL
ncbi:hypothetical protein BC831DRAFT_267550 [Entophlyctis helioformis]|nr:hypothetical protein BC831DRAFT_267550 [Entophlyctis helioformis]